MRALMDMPDKPLLHASRLLHSLAIAAGEISDDVASPTGSERCAAHVEPRTPAVTWESPRLDTPAADESVEEESGSCGPTEPELATEGCAGVSRVVAFEGRFS